MSEEEYNNRIGKINAEISTDRVGADREHYLLLQKLYLKDRYIEDLQQKVKQLEKENIKQKEIIENLTTMTVCGDKKQIKNTAQYKLEQLENIRKETIEYINNNSHYYSTDTNEESFVIDTENEEMFCNDLLNILNKGGEV